jgi:glycosyltransferase involved in cell wall biosynthesis
MKLLYYSPFSCGGLADYAHEQANALVEQGWEVTVLSTPKYPTDREKKYQVVSLLKEFKSRQIIQNKSIKAIDFATVTISNIGKLANFIEQNNFQYVLLSSYVEYFAPLWSGRLKKLADRGVIFGAIVHDPVRDFVVGPPWWHRWSIACGYSFLREAFVHQAITLDTVKPMPQLQTTVIPHGIYGFSEPSKSPLETRKSLNLPVEAKVMLSFGHIRDNKNLDLAIHALVDFPDLYLLVAGQEQSSSQKPLTYYQNLAENLRVSDRCRWIIEFIPDTEVANLFTAVDLVLLTYSSTFRSASGVLNTSAYYRQPCLASGGDSPLRTVVKHYNLGIWVEPDNLDAIIQGIEQWLENPPLARWETYFAENSWSINAELVNYRFGSNYKLHLNANCT